MVAGALKKLELAGAGKRGGMALFAFTARSLQQASTLLITLLAARFLLPAEYGIYSLGVVFIILIQTLTYTGFYQFIITSKEDDRAVLSTSFWMILGLSSIASLLLALAAYPIEWLFDADELGLVLILLALAQPLASFAAWSSAALLRRGGITTNFIVMFWQNLIALIGGALLLFMWHSLYALVAFRYLRVLAGAVLYLVLGRDLPSFHFHRALAKKASSFSAGLYGARFLGFLSSYAADLLLGFLYTANEVGLYRFGNRVATGATDVLSQPMSNFAATQFGAAARQGRPLEGPMSRFAGTRALLTGMIGAILIVFAEDVIESFFDSAYLAALVVTYAMAVRAVAGTGQSLLEPAFSAIGKTGWVLTNSFVTAIAAVLAIFVATPFGLEVLAWSQSAVVLGGSIWALLLLKWKGGVKIRGAIRGFVIGGILAALYGVTIFSVRAWLLPMLELEGVQMLAAGLFAAAAVAPFFLLLGWRFRAFTLHAFSG